VGKFSLIMVCVLAALLIGGVVLCYFDQQPFGFIALALTGIGAVVYVVGICKGLDEPATRKGPIMAAGSRPRTSSSPSVSKGTEEGGPSGILARLRPNPPSKSGKEKATLPK